MTNNTDGLFDARARLQEAANRKLGFRSLRKPDDRMMVRRADLQWLLDQFPICDPDAPPASDAAVPAGEGFDREEIARVLFDQRRTPHNFDDAEDADPESDAGTLRSICFDDADAVIACLGPLAAAPKVASGTGAGLREAAQALVDFIGDGDMRVYSTDLVVRDLRAVLASIPVPPNCVCEVAFGQNPDCPLHGAGTEWQVEAEMRDRPYGSGLATDGATGGGEAACDFWLGDCRRCGKRADREVDPWTNDPHALASELRRVANGWGEGFRIVQLLRDAADQIDTTAATTGVDLLEQAARVVEDGARYAKFAGIAADDAVKADMIGRVIQAAARDIRALCTRNQTDDGGGK